MKVIEIRSEARLQDLKSSWDTLLRECPSYTIFLTWEWVSSWWSSYGVPGELAIIAAFDESGALRGLAPLRRRRARRFGHTVPVLSFIGDGSYDSDYLDFIVAPGCEEEVMESFRARLTEELNRGTVLMLNEIPEGSPNMPWLAQLAGPGRIWIESQVPCGTVHMPQTWETYLAMLRPRFRTKVRSALRNLESRMEVRFGFCETQEQLDRLLPVLFDLHTRRWARDAKPGVFGGKPKREFYVALSSVLLERGWLRFSWLEWNSRVLACQFGFAYNGTYFQLQEGYEPASEHWDAGIGLRAWSIREFLKEGIGEYDFLGGIGRHKTDWGAETKYSKCIVAAGESYKNRLFCRGPEWTASGRECIKRILPQRLIAARAAHAQRGTAGAQSVLPASREWLRKAAAQWYFHCGLPVLGRSLRLRYQLCLSSKGRWPRISWEPRTEPSARIFCYHRINDDRDPFFAALSTEVFEQQMRLVARHHKVVSLDELLNHLERGTAEPVIAITFDDGYLDNYQNAFPILQSYGLPAAIFLTTGSIDSGVALWFEQMAGALKKTARDFIDLEIGIPSRFWLRTQAERLQAYHQIFGLLRGLQDAERRKWLSQILRHLDVQADGGQSNRMLTWEQVRLMSRHGISFGGHTVTHPFLSRMPREDAAWEVSECKRRIEDQLQLRASYFAYPNGREEDIGNWSKDLVQGAGYRAAMSTVWGMNYRSTDRMELRRSGPWETAPSMFASKLDWYNLVNG